MREIAINEDMKKAILRVNNGEPVNFDDIAAFEARSLNTRPLRRKNGLFQAAITQPDMLHEMAAGLNASNEGVPLHVMHDTGMLNIGKLFRARVDTAADGAQELSSQFYVPRQNADVIAKLNSGVTDQVSVGVQAKKIKCSKCDFDYREGGIQNLIAGACPKKHVIGKDGVHVELHGLDGWGEMSLVDRGAAADARTVHAQNTRFQDGTAQFLAANHNELGTSIPLIANLDDITGEETNQVDETKIADLLKAALKENDTATEALKAEMAAALSERDAAVTEKTAALAERDAAKTELTGLTAARDAAVVDRDAVKAELAEATTFLTDQATKAQVAAGVKSPVEVATFKEAIDKINESGLNLVNLFASERTVKTTAEHAVELNASVRAFQPRKDK